MPTLRPVLAQPLELTMVRLQFLCAAICLGIARAALRTLIDLATTKVPQDFTPALRDRPALQLEIARLTAQQEPARLALRSAVETAWCLLCGTTRHAERARGNLGLERAHRDIHAVTQHVILNESWLQDAGRVWLGGEPVNPMFAS